MELSVRAYRFLFSPQYYYFFSEIRRVSPKKFCFLAISSVIAEVENSLI